MEPAARLEDGTPLWLTGEVRVPGYSEHYWTPKGPRRRMSYTRCNAWPILTATPALPDPYLAGRIDQSLANGWGFSHEIVAGRDLLKLARKHLWGPKP